MVCSFVADAKFVILIAFMVGGGTVLRIVATLMVMKIKKYDYFED